LQKVFWTFKNLGTKKVFSPVFFKALVSAEGDSMGGLASRRNRLVSKQTYRLNSSSRTVIAKAVCAVQSSEKARNRHKSTRKTMKFLIQRLDCTRKITALQ